MFQDVVILMQDIHGLILVAARDFGRCPLASRMNRALWPAMGKPVLQRLVDQLVDQGLQCISICCVGQMKEIETALRLPKDLSIHVIEEPLPRGPAGAIRDASDLHRDKATLVIPACTVFLPHLKTLVQRHRQSNCEMTVFGSLGGEPTFSGHAGQLYLCQPSIVDHIPEVGYFDIKEGLVPAVIKSGKSIQGVNLSTPIASYTNWHEYMAALKHLLIDEPRLDLHQEFSSLSGNPDIWLGENTRISETAKIVGPVVIGDNSTVADKALLLGPAIIGNNVSLGPRSIIEGSVLWDHSSVGTDCLIRNSLIDHKKAVPSHSVISDQLRPLPQKRIQKAFNEMQHRLVTVQARPQHPPARTDKEPFTCSAVFQNNTPGLLSSALIAAVFGSLIFTYWDPTLKDLWGIWMRSDEYSCGLLVPFMAGYVIWLRKDAFLQCRIHHSLWGLGILIAIQLFRYWGFYYMFDSGERLAFVLSIGSLVLFIFGSSVFWNFLPVFLFLFLMLPLPNRIEALVTTPLQGWATMSSVFCLEAAGCNVVREGNVININGTLVAIAEACNGLRMLTAFIVVSSVTALISNRKTWEKAVVIASSIPVALFCNTIRLTATSFAFTKLDAQAWEKVFHDYGGWAMMPLALAILFFELWLLSNVLIEPKPVTNES